MPMPTRSHAYMPVAGRTALKPRPPTHYERVLQDLRKLGATPRATLSLAGRYLPDIIHPHEQVKGIVYGRCHGVFSMLVATDRRILFLEKQPLFMDEDEISYYMVGGISYSKAGIGATVTLHTRIKDFAIKTLNERCAEGFVHYIETRCLEKLNGGTYDYYSQERNI